ncbi:GTP cyclohydrolase 1 type 2 homolog [Desulfarculales bacterium]
MTKSHPTVADLITLMDEWAPAWTAESWDRVGLVTGDPAATVTRVWVALELTPELLEAALAEGVDMLLLHHPLLFKPLTDLCSHRPATARLVQAATRGLAIFAAHTNLDAAPGGVSDALAQRLGLGQTRPLSPLAPGSLVKLVTFVPPSHYEEVSAALFAAGAGRISFYRDCAFVASGTGTFLAPPEANPYLGRAGQRERVSELRLETLVPRAQASQALAALRLAHPYEEPAVDLYPLSQTPTGFGLGRVGSLASPRPVGEFAAWAADELGANASLLAGVCSENLRRVAVVGGSGGDLLGAAARAGAQMLVTGEARYHAAQEAADLGLALLTLGHFQTEVVVLQPWARRLAVELGRLDLDCQVEAYQASQDPWRHPSGGSGPHHD